jgi:hypothetical protein
VLAPLDLPAEILIDPPDTERTSSADAILGRGGQLPF